LPAELLDRLTAVETAVAALGEPRRLIVTDGEGQPRGQVIERHHAALPDLVRILTARGPDGHGLSAFLVGPAGSGKTTLAAQAAHVLGLSFAMHGAMTDASQLLGFVDAGGTYRETAFVRAYRDGGLCLLDEVDAGAADAILAINAALSNGHLSLSDGTAVPRHPRFRCIAAGNTFGTGATLDYIGRAPLDGATLDRFVFLPVDYDEALERALAGNDAWVDRVQRARAAARKAGLRVIVSPRASYQGAALIAAGMAPDRAAELTYLRGLDAAARKVLA
jgi:cobaltochelatase CobS